MNPYSLIHTERNGNRIAIVSMEDIHLVNTINLFLLKAPAKAVSEARNDAYAGYAPEGMDDRQRRTLGLRRMTQSEAAKIEDTLQEFEDRVTKEMLEKAIPYIIVGVTRNDTRAGVVTILQKLTGITGRLDYKVPQIETRHVGLLTSAFDKDDDIWDYDERDPDEGDRG